MRENFMRLSGLILVGALLAACSPPAATTSETTAEAPATRTALATVDAPADGARVTSPLIVTGTAPAEATIVLQEDMPEEGATPREVRVPVILAPN
jgi:hypothetical protein